MSGRNFTCVNSIKEMNLRVLHNQCYPTRLKHSSIFTNTLQANKPAREEKRSWDLHVVASGWERQRQGRFWQGDIRGGEGQRPNGCTSKTYCFILTSCLSSNAIAQATCKFAIYQILKCGSGKQICIILEICIGKIVFCNTFQAWISCLLFSLHIQNSH